MFRQSALTAKFKPKPLWSLALIPVVATAGAYYLAGSAHSQAATAAFLADPLSVFASRSPGERRAGALLQSKQAYAAAHKPGGAAGAVPPSERVLSNVRSRPPVGPLGDVPTFGLPAGVVPAGPAEAVPGEGASDAPFAAPFTGGVGGPFAAGIFPGGGGVGGGGAGGGGTGGGGGGGGVIGGGTPPVLPAIPEPTTWAMMLLGFLGIGASLRHRRRLGLISASADQA